MKAINFKVDEKTKADFEEVVSRFGVSSSSFFTIFMKKVIEQNGFPFEVTLHNMKTPEYVKYEDIEDDETLSKETLIFKPINAEITHHVVWKKRNSKNEIYYLFELIEGKSVMNWIKLDYEIAEKQIFIHDIPIIMFTPEDSTMKYVHISEDYRY